MGESMEQGSMTEEIYDIADRLSDRSSELPGKEIANILRVLAGVIDNLEISLNSLGQNNNSFFSD